MKHKIYFLVLISLLFCMGSVAQQNRFVYIQTENKQPFYVRISNTVLSSSASGYLIIPKLKEGTYQMNIGFPKNEWPQQLISLTLNKKDAGFLLRDFGDKGWGLVNLQTAEILMAKSTVIKENNNNNDVDSFTQVLSDVVNSPDLKRKTVVTETTAIVVKEAAKKEEPVAKKEEPVAKREEPIAKNEEPVAKRIVDEKSVQPVINTVKLVMNNMDNKGRVMIYTDNTAGGSDTIRIFIPARETVITTAAAKVVKKTEQPTEKFIDIELANPNAKKDSMRNIPATTPVEADTATKMVPAKSIVMVNSNCRANASDEDFIKLRKKMAASDNDDGMISVAKRGFKIKCYSTAQVKNLGFLFLNDAGRYAFFDAAYPFVSDTTNFSSLQQQLTDPYFISRFQAMIRR